MSPAQPVGLPLVGNVLPPAVRAQRHCMSHTDQLRPDACASTTPDSAGPAGSTAVQPTATVVGHPRPAGTAAAEAYTPWSLYIHVPFCRVRCGYCDFNTYTNLSMGPGASREEYPVSVRRELELAVAALGEAGVPPQPAQTVFLGGGTPTMLDAAQLGEILAAARDTMGIAPGAEVTVEANPETVDAPALAALAQAGVTRVSVGMQSAVPHVLRTLDRQHRPERVPQVITWAREAGLDCSVDLIYGAPGESIEEWRRSVEAAIAMRPDHISAYALVIEEGTKMWAQVRRGELPMPSDDDEATKYEIADSLLAQAGYEWYEISNWAQPGHECAHNQAYWRDTNWWGIGPGAHSHVGDMRAWNVKHPLAWAGQVAAGQLPVAGHEVIDAESRELERIMLGIRTREGLRVESLHDPSGGQNDAERSEDGTPIDASDPLSEGAGTEAAATEAAVTEDAVPGVAVRAGEYPVTGGTRWDYVGICRDLLERGLVEEDALRQGSLVLTLRGRLMADAVTDALTPWL